MTDTKADYENAVSLLAEQVHHILAKDMFSRDYCIRYNEKGGAYLSVGEDLNDDVIILRADSKFASMTYPQLQACFVKRMGNQPFFAV